MVDLNGLLSLNHSILVCQPLTGLRTIYDYRHARCHGETTGDSIAIGESVDKPIAQKELASMVRADGISTLMGEFLIVPIYGLCSKRRTYCGYRC